MDRVVVFLSLFLSRVRVSGNPEIRTDDPRRGRVVAHAWGGPQRLPRRSDEREPARFVSVPLSFQLLSPFSPHALSPISARGIEK